MKMNRLFCAFGALTLSALCCMTGVHALAAETAFELPVQEVVTSESPYARVTQENTFFTNGDFFWVRRYEFLTDSNSPYISRFSIPGDQIEIRSIVEKNGGLEWENDVGMDDIPAGTLFISTDCYHIIIGVPAVYVNNSQYASLDAVPSEETPVRIVKVEGGYEFILRFPQDTRYMGEIWALQSKNRLVEWNAHNQELFMGHDLAYGKRLSMDGYYIKSPSSYDPTGKNMYYRIPSTYSGGSFAREMTCNAITDLGYVIMKSAARNQNELGFFPTMPRSDWLYKDFGIGYGFFDTRFNNDFGHNLINAYLAYRDEEFFDVLVRYGDFYISHAANNNYPTGEGILVSDYWHEEPHEKTHVSLNHHVDGLFFLLRLYELTRYERYLEIAGLMLYGIEETYQEWVLEDNNLKYALYYTGSNNVMVDYPSLTYNDLFKARPLIESVFKRESHAIRYLMECKLEWMNKNGVTDYRK